jgi:hypothetical protein
MAPDPSREHVNDAQRLLRDSDRFLHVLRVIFLRVCEMQRNASRIEKQQAAKP